MGEVNDGDIDGRVDILKKESNDIGARVVSIVDDEIN